MRPRYTIGIVPYLNARPLSDPLRGRQDVRLVAAHPSDLSRRMARGEFDAALIPTVEYVRAPYRIIGDYAIGGDGDALSVRLYFRTWPSEIRRLALDPSSRTTNALASIVCAGRHGVEPTPCRLPRSGRWWSGSSACDAAVVIGDRALREETRRTIPFPWLDLGGEWKALTGLPFVFALWLAPREDRRLGSILNEAAEEGIARIPREAARWGKEHGFPAEFSRHYLTRSMRYPLTRRAIEGVKRFRTLYTRGESTSKLRVARP